MRWRYEFCVGLPLAQVRLLPKEGMVGRALDKLPFGG